MAQGPENIPAPQPEQPISLTPNQLGHLLNAALREGYRQGQHDTARMFGRTAAHLLNNKLALTVGYAEVAQTLVDDPDAKEMMKEAYRGADEAAHIVGQLLHIKRFILDPHASASVGEPVLDLEESVKPPITDDQS
jgi:signal transduction histidine kinase